MAFDKFLRKINEGFWAKDPVTNLAKTAEEVGISHNASIGAINSGVVQPIPDVLQNTHGKGYMTRNPGSLFGTSKDIEEIEKHTKQYMDDWKSQNFEF